METYKYQGYKVGQVIKAFEFMPMEGRPDRFNIGAIKAVNIEGSIFNQYAHYVIWCEIRQDEICVPMEIGLGGLGGDHDDRIKVIGGAV